MKAGIDLDGVLADLVNPLIRELNKRYDLSLAYEDVTSYYFANFLRGDIDLEDIKSIWESPEFILKQPLLPWARWGVERLKKLEYEIHIITARKSHLKSFTIEWLDRNQIPYDDIVTGKRNDKWLYIERHGLDIFVDDHHTHALNATNFCNRVYLMDAPHNLHLPSGKEIIRVNSWRDLIKLERGFLSEGNSLR